MADPSHPIAPPPPELVEQWIEETSSHDCISRYPDDFIWQVAAKAAQWGADIELEACCEWFQEFYKIETWVKHDLKHFRNARRPKPPSLKKQAIADFKWLIGRTVGNPEADTRSKRILQALESLSDD